MTTRKGELSVKADRVELLAKAVRPMPDKWHGLTDTDTRFRQRYADLIVNEEARRAFRIRHEIVASFRRTLQSEGFIEVETPVLHLESGGAHARPFITHHNALDMQLYLRIALELHLGAAIDQSREDQLALLAAQHHPAGHGDTLVRLGPGLQRRELSAQLIERMRAIEPVRVRVGARVAQRPDLVEPLGLLGRETTAGRLWFGRWFLLAHKGMTVPLRRC
jgi:hypothetical protein